MAIWLNIASTGFGIQYNANDDNHLYRYRWNAHSFWPSYENQEYDEETPAWNTIAIYEESTSFDLTDFQPGHEVVMYVNEIRWNAGYSGQWTLEFQDPEGTTLYISEYGRTFDAPPSGWTAGSYAWIAIGVRPNPWPEIYSNGIYRAITSGIVSNTTYFTITNLDTTLLTRYPGYEGTAWIEGENLHYISRLGTEHTMLAQPGEETSAGVAGAIWMSNTEYRIHWTDENGVARKSKLGDRYDVESRHGGRHYVGESKKGYFWARYSPGWTTLHGICYDGYLTRFGPGYLHNSGDNVTGDGDCQ